ncbi:MAG TPA: M23 family metallopeptidase [Gemmatimonadaceae bacterium]|nr:M23 family metallopeptidase [Gemmatimonadaceae bacterium]
MKLRSARAITYTVVAVLAFVAIRATPQLAVPSATVARDTLPTPSWELSYDSVVSGGTLAGVLMRGGLSGTDAGAVVHAASPVIDPRRVPVGLRVAVLHSAPGDSQPPEVVIALADDDFLHLTRDSSGWVTRDERLPWVTDTIAVQGSIHTNLYQAMYAAADGLLPRDAQDALVVRLADDVYEYRVDMSRDLQDGDSFRVLAERSRLANGTVKIGNIVAAQLVLSGSEMDAIHFTDDQVSGNYFDQNGRSLKSMFLRVPLKFKYITSSFGRRFHPILKRWRNHEGIDYAANSGTPVRAIGAGTVVRAGTASGYGNLVEIRHARGYSSRYGHLRAFAKGIHAGAHVDIGQTIGYVGMTGLATGPHLHFEFLVHGAQRDPRVALRNVGTEPLPSSLVAQFDSLRDRLLGQLVARTGGHGVMTVALR